MSAPGESVIKFPEARGVLRAAPSPELQDYLKEFLSATARRNMGARGLYLFATHTVLLDQHTKIPVEPLPEQFTGNVALYGRTPRRLGKAVGVKQLQNKNLRIEFSLPILNTDRLFIPLTDAGFVYGGVIDMFAGIRHDQARRRKEDLQIALGHLTHFIMGDHAHPSLGMNPRVQSPNTNAYVTHLQYRNG